MLNDVITVLHQQLYFQSKHRKNMWSWKVRETLILKIHNVNVFDKLK